MKELNLQSYCLLKYGGIAFGMKVETKEGKACPPAQPGYYRQTEDVGLAGRMILSDWEQVLQSFYH